MLACLQNLRALQPCLCQTLQRILMNSIELKEEFIYNIINLKIVCELHFTEFTGLKAINCQTQQRIYYATNNIENTYIQSVIKFMKNDCITVYFLSFTVISKPDQMFLLFCSFFKTKLKVGIN